MKSGRPDSGGSKGGRVGPNYPESHYENPMNVGLDKWYAEGEDRKTLESPTANTIDHAGLKLDKTAYDRYWGPKSDVRGER